MKPMTYAEALKWYHRCLRAELRITNGPLTHPQSLAAAKRATERTNKALRAMAEFENP